MPENTVTGKSVPYYIYYILVTIYRIFENRYLHCLPLRRRLLLRSCVQGLSLLRSLLRHRVGQSKANRRRLRRGLHSRVQRPRRARIEMYSTRRLGLHSEQWRGLCHDETRRHVHDWRRHRDGSLQQRVRTRVVLDEQSRRTQTLSQWVFQ